jgi:cell division protein FtsQ
MAEGLMGAASAPVERGARGKVVQAFKWLLLLSVVAGLVWGGRWLYQRYDVPVAVIGVDGELVNVKAGDVEQIVAANLGGGFLSLDLEGICQALEQHPWVDRASARRKWPDEVVITIREETAIARWGKNQFLSNQGQILDIGDAVLPRDLPLLQGPEGFERRVMQQYRNFSQILGATGMELTEFRLAERGNWVALLSPGITLVVGKEPVAPKLDRFLLVWGNALKARRDLIDRIDLRYGNGLAVRWKNENEPAADAGSTS